MSDSILQSSHKTNTGLFLFLGLSIELSYLLAEGVGGFYTNGYNYFDNTASELMAIGSEERFFFAPFYFIHSLMISLFGYSLTRRYSHEKYSELKMSGYLLIQVGLCYALACSIFPMDPPESIYSISGYMHVILVGIGVLSLISVIPITGGRFANLYDWKWFKKFSFLCFFLVFIAAIFSPIILYTEIALMGLTERIIGHVSSIWVVVLAYKIYKEPFAITDNQHSEQRTDKKGILIDSPEFEIGLFE